MKNPFQKRVKKTKEQLLQENQFKAEVARMRPLAHSLFECLQGTSSITHAQRTCEILKAVIQNKMNQYWAERTIGDLGLMEELTGDPTMKDRDLFMSLLTTFADVRIVDAMKIVDGMGGSIDGYLKKQNMNKPFTDIKQEELIA